MILRTTRPACYLRVVNWEKFQHYKDRGPKWIKFYAAILDDPVICALPDQSKAHLFLIWLFAARVGNKLLNDATWLRAKIGARLKVDLRALIAASFLEHHQDCACGRTLDELRGHGPNPEQCASAAASETVPECLPRGEERRERAEERQSGSHARAHESIPPTATAPLRAVDGPPPEARIGIPAPRDEGCSDPERALNGELYQLVQWVALKRDEDPAEVLKRFSMYRPRGADKPRWLTNVEAGSWGERMRTLQDLRSERDRLLAAERGAPTSGPVAEPDYATLDAEADEAAARRARA